MFDTMHSKRCLAESLISAVQNMRDDKDVTDHDFRIIVQDNDLLPIADDYLRSGLQTCTCGAQDEDLIVDMFGSDPDGAQDRRAAERFAPSLHDDCGR